MKKVFPFLVSLLFCTAIFGMNPSEDVDQARIDAMARIEEGHLVQAEFKESNKGLVEFNDFKKYWIDQLNHGFASPLPEDLELEVGSCLVQDNSAFIEKNMKKLIPAVIPCHKYYPSMFDMVDRIVEAFYRQYKRITIKSSAKPYIVAVCGFWSYADEDTAFRFMQSPAHDYQTCDAMAWLQHKYPHATLIPLQYDQFMAVLYSDGSIKWMVSNAIKKAINGLFKHQIEMCIHLYNQPNYVQKNSWNDTPEDLPICMIEAIKSNYRLSKHKTSFLAKTVAKNGLKIVGLASLFGIQAYGCGGSGDLSSIPRLKRDIVLTPKSSFVLNRHMVNVSAAIGFVAAISIGIEQLYAAIKTIPRYINHGGRGAAIVENPNRTFWENEVPKHVNFAVLTILAGAATGLMARGLVGYKK